MQPLNWIFLTVILLEVCWLEVFRVLGISKDAAEGWKAISIVREAHSSPGVDDVRASIPEVVPPSLLWSRSLFWP